MRASACLSLCTFLCLSVLMAHNVRPMTALLLHPLMGCIDCTDHTEIIRGSVPLHGSLHLLPCSFCLSSVSALSPSSYKAAEPPIPSGSLPRWKTISGTRTIYCC